MARRFTDEEKAKTKVILDANNGNVAKTAREMGISRETVQKWKQKWDKEGLPEQVTELLAITADQYLQDCERVRNLTLQELEARIRQQDSKLVTTRDLIVAYGILEDKIARTKGSDIKRTETVVHMPDVKELGSNLGKFIAASLEAARERQQTLNTVNTEIAVQRALEQG